MDKLKLLRLVLENMNPSEMEEFGIPVDDQGQWTQHVLDGYFADARWTAGVDEHLIRACWVPNCLVRFVDDETYLLNSIEFVGQSINESWVDPMSEWAEAGPMTSPRPAVNRPLTTTEKITRREVGVPMDLELPQESDDDFELIEAVLRYIQVRTWDLNFQIVMELTQ